MALWGIPTAIFVFLVHSVRLIFFDRRLNKKYGNNKVKAGENE
jgi:uncharacterized membrane protein